MILCADPLFMDRNHGDFTLHLGSPAIGAGDASGRHAGATDLAGNPRVAGDAVDMGAYERPAAAKLEADFVVSDKVYSTAGVTASFSASLAGPGADSATLEYATPATGFRTFEPAMDALAFYVDDGKTVEIRPAPGKHMLERQLALDGAIRIVGTGDTPAEIVLDGGTAYRHVKLSAPDALLANVTVIARYTAGIEQSAGIVSNGVVRGDTTGINEAMNYISGGLFTDNVVSNLYMNWVWSVFMVRQTGGTIANTRICDAKKFGEMGLYMTAGVLTNCVFSGLKPRDTEQSGMPYCCAKITGGLATDCVFTNNGNRVQTGYGTGGARSYAMVEVGGSAVLRNSLIAQNAAYQRSGLACISANASIENCTVADNESNTDSALAGCDLYLTAGTVVNSVFAGHANTADGGIAKSGGTMANCLTAPEIAGTGNVHGLDPLFVNPAAGDYRPNVLSPLIDAGSVRGWHAGGIDLGGGVRVEGAAVDIGAYEAPAATEGDFRANFFADATSFAAVPAQPNLTAAAAGVGATGATFAWYIDREPTGEADATGAEYTPALAAGTHTIALVATAGDEVTKVTVTRADYITVIDAAQPVYVSKTGSATMPYDTPEKGFTSVNEAIAYLSPASEIGVAVTIYVMPAPTRFRDSSICTRRPASMASARRRGTRCCSRVRRTPAARRSRTTARS